jgi:hypothetical protein
MSPEPMIGQHDDRAFYHRRHWERSERSETKSASRTVSNIRTNAIGDAVMIASGGIRRTRNNSVGRCHVGKYLFGRSSKKAAIRHITHKL